MSTDVIVRKANVGDSLAIVVGKYEVNVDGVTVLRDPHTGIVSAAPSTGLPALPVPKVWILRDPHTGTLSDGNTVQCQHTIMATAIDMPNVFFNPVYQLQLELVRYKTRARTHNVRKAGAGFVHPTHFVGGASTPAVRGTRGGAHNIAVDRQTEWPATGLTHNSVIKLPMGNVFTAWFDINVGWGVDSTGVVSSLKYVRYRDGKSRAIHSALNKRGISDMRQTGVFRLRWSYYDPINKERVSGPESANIVIFNKYSASIPRWMYGLTVNPTIVEGSHILNPNLISGKIELVARINARERV